MAQLTFNANTVAPDTGTGDPVPAGWYNVQMDESEMKPTSGGDGAYLNCRFAVLDGAHVGRKIFGRLNLQNKNAVAQEIAYKQLSAICHAVGMLEIQDSTQLHGRPLKIKVKLRPASGDYEASNDISAYKNINEPTAGAIGGPPMVGMQMPVMGAANPMQAAPMQNPMQQMQAAPAQMFQQTFPAQQQQQPMQQQQQMPAGAPMQQQFAPQQQPMQQAPQQAPVQQFQQQPPVQGAIQQPWEQQGGVQQPWSQPAPQQMQAVQQAPMQQQAPQQQMQQQPAQQNPAVQQYAGAVPPWQQQAAQ